jgi:hypothetical protein
MNEFNTYSSDSTRPVALDHLLELLSLQSIVIPANVTSSNIRDIYKKICLINHPDKKVNNNNCSNNCDAFLSLAEAYLSWCHEDVLTNPSAYSNISIDLFSSSCINLVLSTPPARTQHFNLNESELNAKHSQTAQLNKLNKNHNVNPQHHLFNQLQNKLNINNNPSPAANNPNNIISPTVPTAAKSVSNKSLIDLNSPICVSANNSIYVHWTQPIYHNSNSPNQANLFELEMKIKSRYQLVYHGCDTAYTVPNLQPGTKYMFRLKLLLYSSTAGNIISLSNEEHEIDGVNHENSSIIYTPSVICCTSGAKPSGDIPHPPVLSNLQLIQANAKKEKKKSKQTNSNPNNQPNNAKPTMNELDEQESSNSTKESSLELDGGCVAASVDSVGLKSASELAAEQRLLEEIEYQRYILQRRKELEEEEKLREAEEAKLRLEKLKLLHNQKSKLSKDEKKTAVNTTASTDIVNNGTKAERSATKSEAKNSSAKLQKFVPKVEAAADNVAPAAAAADAAADAADDDDDVDDDDDDDDEDIVVVAAAAAPVAVPAAKSKSLYIQPIAILKRPVGNENHTTSPAVSAGNAVNSPSLANHSKEPFSWSSLSKSAVNPTALSPAALNNSLLAKSLDIELFSSLNDFLSAQLWYQAVCYDMYQNTQQFSSNSTSNANNAAEYNSIINSLSLPSLAGISSVDINHSAVFQSSVDEEDAEDLDFDLSAFNRSLQFLAEENGSNNHQTIPPSLSSIASDILFSNTSSNTNISSLVGAFLGEK